jgi:hypothetical protein
MMTNVWAAFWIGVGVPSALYLAKRLIDWAFVPGVHLPWLDRFTRPNNPDHQEDTEDDYS